MFCQETKQGDKNAEERTHCPQKTRISSRSKRPRFADIIAYQNRLTSKMFHMKGCFRSLWNYSQTETFVNVPTKKVQFDSGVDYRARIFKRQIYHSQLFGIAKCYHIKDSLCEWTNINSSKDKCFLSERFAKSI